MPRTPDRRPGRLEEDEEIFLEATATGPSAPGAFNFDGTDFKMRDAAGVFNPRGLTATQHEVVDSLIHELAETSYLEVTRSGNLVTDIIVWETSAKLKKVREANITRVSDLISTVVEKQYDASGALAQTLTHSVTRSSGRVTSIDTVET